MEIREKRAFRTRTLILLAATLTTFVYLLPANWQTLHAALTAKTWDGGGATNNWSEAANWSDDIVPVSGDIVTFDGTSTKDATIDTNISIGALQIAAGYTGTITQSNSASVSISGCPGRACFVQDAGTFNGSSNTITINSSGFGAIRINGGAFNGGSGDIGLLGGTGSASNILMLGGTFKSTNGNMTVAGNFTIQGVSATFVHNNGKVTLTSPQNGSIGGDSDHLTVKFHDLELSPANGTNYLLGTRPIVEGNLILTDGSIEPNGGVIESRGGLTISPTFDGGNASLELANGAAPRTFAFDTGMVLPRIVINDPNVTINTSGSGTLSFPHSFVLQQGTFNQGSVNLLFGPRPGGGACYTQNGGVFNGSSNTITTNGNGFGSISMTGGSFNGGSGDMNLAGSSNASLLLQGGTFTSTSGNMVLPGNFTIQGAGTSFIHNNGKVTLTDLQNGSIGGDSFNLSVNFHDLELSLANGTNFLLGIRPIVEGNLLLTDGSIEPNGGVIEARGGLTISPNFDGGNASLELANGAGPRTFAFDTTFTLPRVTLNDPNVTINTSGSGTLNFPHSLTVLQGTFNQGSVDLLFGPRPGGGFCYTQGGGVFNGSSHTITTNGNGFGSITMSGGLFSGGSGDMNLAGSSNANLTVLGGTFTSTSGLLTIPGSFVFQGTTSVFQHHNGTVAFTSGQGANINTDSNHPTVTFNNLTIDKMGGVGFDVSSRIIVLGGLILNDGTVGVNGGIIEARGALTIAPTFDGGLVTLELANGIGPRNFTFDTVLVLPKVVINDPNVAVNTSGSGTLTFPHSFTIQQGTFNQGNVDVSIMPPPGGGPSYTQSNGTYNGSSNVITFISNGFGSFTQSGGAFNGGSGDISLTGDDNSDHDFRLSGGSFRSTSGTFIVDRGFRVTGGTFDHNNGKILFIGSGNQTLDFSGIAAGVVLNTVDFDRDNGTAPFLFGKMITVGPLSLIDGGLQNSGTIEAQGDVTIASGFDGGGPNIFIFGGNAVQTFTNNGAPNPPAAWTLNKTGGTVNLASNLDLSNGPASALNLLAGTITTGNFELNAGTRTIVRSGGYVSGNLRRDFSTTGVKTYDVGTANAYAPVSVNVLNPISGTQGLTVGEFQGAHPNLDPSVSLGRYWTLVEHGTVAANLTFNYVDPLDIHGVETAYRVAQINSTVNFFTDAQIPINRAANSFTINNVTDFASYSLGQPTVSITPANISLPVQGTQTFVGSGGTLPYSYTLAANNSFGSIDPVTGLYTAGTHSGVQDMIKVTDSEGRIAFATADVTPGAAAQLFFAPPPGTINANTPISPPLQVVIQDQFGNIIQNATDAVTAAIANNPGGGTLSGTTTRNAVNGIATFDDLSINLFGNGYTLHATSGSLTPSTTSPFNVLGPVQLAFFNEQAANPIIQNTPFTLEVEVQDQFGQRFPNATNSVTLSIANNPGGGTLSGVTTLNASNGLAVFNGLSIDAPGDGYTFNAASNGLTPAGSAPYNIVTPFVVTNTSDGLPGSLRSAITAANATPGVQTISFEIGGPNPHRITLGTNLPDITDPVIIDATTQPGFAGTPVVEIDSHNIVTAGGINAHAFKILSGNSTVRGFAMYGYHDSTTFGGSAFFIAGGGSNTIEGNWIGISASGVSFFSDNGFVVLSPNNLIGGSLPSQRNVISGHQQAGVNIKVNNNVVSGNFIGTDPTGVSAVPNLAGILTVTSAAQTIIEKNLVSGNSGTGIIIGANSVTVRNNIIGLNATTNGPLGNGGSGVLVKQATSSDLISQNHIQFNGQLGIQLGLRGVLIAPPLPNDPGDTDLGPNHQQNYPVLTSVAPIPGSTNVAGDLNSIASSVYTLEFFSNPSCDPSGNGEGANFMGSTVVNTDINGNVNFNVNLPVTISNTDFVTATATDAAGNTSEFSACRGPQANISGTVKTAGGQPIQGATVNLTNDTTGVARFGTTNSLGAYSFTGQPLGQNYTVSPSKPNFTFSPASATHHNLAADPNDAFTGTLQTFTISGQVTLGGASLSGVTMTLSGGANATVATDSSGNYSFANLIAGSYTVTPSLQNFSFSPASATLNISSNQTADFAATNLLASLTGKIAFVSSRGISRMNADGSGLALIIANTRSSTFLSPAISKNGSKLAYIEHSIGGLGTNTLKVSNADGSSPVSLTTLDSGRSDFGLAWSPDQTIVTACKTVSGVVKLINVAVSTGTITSIVSSGTTNEQPVWSPDGTKIAFSRDDVTTTLDGRAIFTVSANGTGLTKLTFPALVDSLPTWSPDGTKIAFLRSLSGITTEVFVMNPDGTGQNDVFSVPITEQLSDIEWAPDSSRLAIITRSGTAQRLVSILPNGTSELVISSNLGGTAFDWSPTPFVLIPPGTGVGVTIGRVGVNLPSVPFNGAGNQTLTAEPISPASLGDPPPNFVYGNFAYDISTDGTFTPPATVCIDLPSDAYPDAASFNELSLLHYENGLFTDITSSRDLGNFRLCGQSATLGSFVVAEHINASLPSITGLVVDQNGNPVDDITLSLTGSSSQQATTGFDGTFHFVDLVQGGNYVLTPTTIGSTYNAPFAGFLSLNAEQSAVFVATPGNFGISGTITDENQLPADGVTVSLSGTVDNVTLTDADGKYSFEQLPSGGSYVVAPSVEGSVFFPNYVPIDSLQNNLTAVDFEKVPFSQGPFSIGGRLTDTNGQGLTNVLVVLTGDSASALRTAKSNPFGYYRFDNVPGSQSYTVSVSTKRYDFANPSQVINVIGDLTDVNFVGARR